MLLINAVAGVKKKSRFPATGWPGKIIRWRYRGETRRHPMLRDAPPPTHAGRRRLAHSLHKTKGAAIRYTARFILTFRAYFKRPGDTRGSVSGCTRLQFMRCVLLQCTRDIFIYSYIFACIYRARGCADRALL